MIKYHLKEGCNMEKTFYELVCIDRDDWISKSKYLNDDIIQFLSSCYDGDFDLEFVGTDVSKFKQLVRLIRISNASKSFFEHFPSYSEEEVLEALTLLDHEIIDLFIRAYGKDLKHPICRANLTNDERVKVNNSFSHVERKLIGRNQSGFSCKNVFALLPSYSEEEIWDAFYRMPFRYQEELISAYGKNLDDASFREKMSKSEKSKVSKVTQSVLVPRLKDKSLGRNFLSFSSLFEFFPHFSENRIYEVFESLSDVDKDIIRKAFGEDLKGSAEFLSLSLVQRKKAYDVIRDTFYQELESGAVFTGRRPKNVFEYFPKYNNEEIWEAFSRLSIQDQDLLKRAYGRALTDPSGRLLLSTEERKIVDQILKGPFRRRLKNANLSSEKLMKKYHVKQFFEYFPLFNKEEISDAFALLTADEQLFLIQIYGPDLNGIPSELDYEDKKVISSIIKKISPMLSSKKKRKNLYDFFPDFSHEEVYEGFLLLKPEYRDLLIKAYGEDLTDSSLFEGLDEFERKTVYRIISTTLRDRVNPLTRLGRRKIKSVFDILSTYSRDEVLMAFEKLNADDQALVKTIYGESLEDLSNFYSFSASDRRKAYAIIYKKMSNILKGGKQRVRKASPKKREKSVSKTAASTPRKSRKRKATTSRSSHVMTDDFIPFTSNVITDTLSKDSYRPISASKERWYMKKLKLSYYYSSDTDDAARKLYLDYYSEVTPRFKKKYDMASSSEREVLLDNAIEDSLMFRNEFLRNNHRLITRIIYVISNNSDLSYEELFQEGFIGMMRALEKFDFAREVRFSTYANYWISQAINRYICSKGKLVRTPVYFSERHKKVRAFITRFYQEFYRMPTTQEIASELGIPIENVKKMELYSAELFDPKSLDSKIYDDEVKSFYEVVSDGHDFTFDVVNKDHLKYLKKVIEESDLNSEQILVLYLKYGLVDGVCYSNDEIAQKMGISLLEVRTIYSVVVRKMRGNPRILDVLKGAENNEHFSNGLSLKQLWYEIESLLDETSFKIFYMVYVQEMEIDEVSRKLNMPYNEVFKISVDSLKTVRDYISKMQDKPKILTWA